MAGARARVRIPCVCAFPVISADGVFCHNLHNQEEGGRLERVSTVVGDTQVSRYKQ